MDNGKIIAQINQLFHNQGIKQEERFNQLIEILEKKRTFKELSALLDSLDYDNKDVIQSIFMGLGSKLTKFNLDQFYTPLTIAQFINSLMLEGRAIDPAGGTGDLLLHYKGQKEIWDIDENALNLCKLNYELNKLSNYKLVCRNSLLDYSEFQGKWDYVVMNPPFGTSTVITDKKILESFELSKGKKKQEIGILFLELGLKLLKDNGILFIIVPAGYLGNANNNCSELRNLLLKNKVIASIALPENTFKRSGTGVSTYLLIVQKNSVEEPYDIFIRQVKNIGYDLTKKDTPLKYKIYNKTGELKLIEGKPILDNDLIQVFDEISTFAFDNNVENLPHSDVSDYEYINSENLEGNVLDIKRYLAKFLTIVNDLKSVGAKPLKKYGKIISSATRIEKQGKYKYIDIGQITWPMYGSKALYGWQVPSRGKYSVQKYDILISKLVGTLSYCVILDDTPNYIVTNGVTVVRPNDMNSLYILVANIIKKEFAIQHNAFLTGSIMASVSDDDIANLLISEAVDVSSIKKIIETLETLVQLQS